MRQITEFHALSDKSPVTIKAVSEPNPAGAVNHYQVGGFDTGTNKEAGLHYKNDPNNSALDVSTDLLNIFFQSGAPAVNGYNGITLEVLLAIGIDRLYSLQAGQFPSHFNEVALYHMGKALDALHDRTESLQPVAVDQGQAAMLAEMAKRAMPEQTLFDPIMTEHNTECFVNPNAVYGTDMHINGKPASTAPLVFGKYMDLIGLTKFQPLIDSDIQDDTDQLGFVGVKTLYMTLPNKTVSKHVEKFVGPSPVVKFDVRAHKLAFTNTQQGERRTRSLSTSVEIEIPQKLLSVNDYPVSKEWEEAAGQFDKITVLCHLAGSVDPALGELHLTVGGVTAGSILINGVELCNRTLHDAHARLQPSISVIMSVLESAQWLCFDLDIQRINNKRKVSFFTNDGVPKEMVKEIPESWPQEKESPAQ